MADKIVGAANVRRDSDELKVALGEERALMVGVEMGRGSWDVQDSLDELEQLAKTAGVEIVGRVTQKVHDPNNATYIGQGKVEEIRLSREQVGYNMVIFDAELSPRQLRNLEETLDVKILDRTALILDIFARHARTHEGRLQVELAQLEYRLPRLTRLWTHLSRQSGGGGSSVGLRGPGETQLEVDRRRARERIARLKDDLKQVHSHRELYRQKRRREGIPVVALVGYTNAGKSTLLNALSGADVLAANVLFATLDPTTRQIALPEGRQILLTDTVGFIQRLPTTLVAAFRATLEEIADADLLVHVLDITHPNAAEQANTVEKLLNELELKDKPRIVALNKIDKLVSRDGASEDGDLSRHLMEDMDIPEDYIPVSAHSGVGLDVLLGRIEEELSGKLLPVLVQIPYSSGDLVALFHSRGTIDREEFNESGTLIEGRIPSRLRPQFSRYITA